MNKFLGLLFCGGLILSTVGCSKDQNNSLLITTQSKYDANESIAILIDTLSSMDGNYTLGEILQHHNIAKEQNIYLKPSLGVTIQNPLLSSALITCTPSIALEFPMRLALYTKLGGAVKISYTNPEYWSLKHNIKDKNCLAVVDKMARDFDISIDKLAED